MGCLGSICGDWRTALVKARQVLVAGVIIMGIFFGPHVGSQAYSIGHCELFVAQALDQKSTR